MAIDVRARTVCSLGPLISASISDDYIQGSGLIKTSGNCELVGVYSLSPGQQVTFSYTKNGITRKIPRTMRVLSSFADPFRRVTTVELGCKLTYLQDLTDPIKWDVFDDPVNISNGRTEAEQDVVTIPFYASSLMNKCLQELGIQATSNPLTNVFSRSEFDFSSGYVSVLSDLLVSESYCGYLDLDERLVIIDLSSEGATGPLISSDKIIDIGPIGIGQLPGDSVVVRYSTLKLKAPDGTEIDENGNNPSNGGGTSGGDTGPWGFDSTQVTSISNSILTWTDRISGEDRYQVYRGLEASTTTTNYSLIDVINSDGTRSRKNLITRRDTITSKSAYSLASNLFSAYLSDGRQIPGNYLADSRVVEFFEYDSSGQESKREKFEYVSALEELGSLGINFVFFDGAIQPANGQILARKETTYFQRLNDFESSRTEEYVTWSRTLQGQQGLVLAKKNIRSLAAMSDYLDSVYGLGLLLNGISLNSSKTGARPQEAPTQADITNGNNADTSDPSSTSENGFRTESSSEIEFVSGDRSAQRRVELSMPYAPDSIFTKSTFISSGGGSGTATSYFATASDAPQKANKFGRVQNRMLLGNRNGMNIQTTPETLPNEPFSPVFIQAGSVVALYKTNGMSWTVDENGIIASTDAMFWGTAGTVT